MEVVLRGLGKQDPICSSVLGGWPGMDLFLPLQAAGGCVSTLDRVLMEARQPWDDLRS